MSLTGKLLPSVETPVVKTLVSNGTATLKRLAWGAFTVGIDMEEHDGTRTQLELDLSELPSAPMAFRLR